MVDEPLFTGVVFTAEGADIFSVLAVDNRAVLRKDQLGLRLEAARLKQKTLGMIRMIGDEFICTVYHFGEVSEEENSARKREKGRSYLYLACLHF